MAKIEEQLPPTLREDYLKFINVYLNKNKRESLLKTLKEIVEGETSETAEEEE